MPQAQFGPIKVPEGVADERFLYLSDILPDRVAGRRVRRRARGRHPRRVRASARSASSRARIAVHRGIRVIGVDLVPERAGPGRAARRRDHRPQPTSTTSPPAVLRPDRRPRAPTAPSTPSAWRRTAVPSPSGAIKAVGYAARRAGQAADRRRSASTGSPPCARRSRPSAAAAPSRSAGVYGGEVDPMPMMEMFDRGITHADGPVPREALDRRDPAGRHGGRGRARPGVAGHAPAAARRGARGYEMFQEKADGCVKVVLKP